MKCDFSGYATKANLKCTDGKTIATDAFCDQDGEKVPLVWQHMHGSPENVLGHAILEKRDGDMYAWCFCNDTSYGNHAKSLVKHGDINSLSIHANKLVLKSNTVLHGVIREVSLVLAGANPGALIDNIGLQHEDGSLTQMEDEAIIYTGMDLMHSDEKEIKMEEPKEKTLEEVINTMNEEQKNVLYYLVGSQAEEEIKQSAVKEGEEMPRNLFEGDEEKVPALTHSDFISIVDNARRGGSLKEAFLSHAATYGIANIDYLFPDAKTITSTPSFIARRMEWVSSVLNSVAHTPFSRVKSVHADITADEARARGYIKGNLKKDEVFTLLKRVTTPTTVYKKQKLDRDDVVDITDTDVIAWLKAEMRIMLDEELARAILIGDGREAASADKINEENIRPIWKDADLYTVRKTVEKNADVNVETKAVIDAVIRSRKDYNGTGMPTLYTSADLVTNMLLLKDSTGRDLYDTLEVLKTKLRVKDIVEIPQFENLVRTAGTDQMKLLAICVDLKDYNVGADRGGAVSMFDDFDIDYNQMKYLIETRVSGALITPHSAIVFEKKVN